MKNLHDIVIPEKPLFDSFTFEGLSPNVEELTAQFLKIKETLATYSTTVTNTTSRFWQYGGPKVYDDWASPYTFNWGTEDEDE